MKNISFKKLPAHVQALLVEMGVKAEAKGWPVFLVGGMVRDIILEIPSIDIDVVVEGDGVSFAEGLAAGWGVQALVHRKFGTAAIVNKDGIKIDIVTARREVYARPGALPDVITGHCADDLFRRDFSINAVAVSLMPGELGLIRDDFDGIRDITQGLIRIMHQRSFIDDPTRILRAVRYEKRFGFKFESRTLAALKEALEENAFRAITPVRYFNEFKRILQEKDPRPALRRLATLEGLRFFVFDNRTESRLRSVMRSDVSADRRWVALFAAMIEPLDRASLDELLASFNMTRGDKKSVLRALESPAWAEEKRVS